LVKKQSNTPKLIKPEHSHHTKTPQQTMSNTNNTNMSYLLPALAAELVNPTQPFKAMFSKVTPTVAKNTTIQHYHKHNHLIEGTYQSLQQFQLTCDKHNFKFRINQAAALLSDQNFANAYSQLFEQNRTELFDKYSC
jgi:hypothetical protein